jgi:hypothetical protein
LPTAEQQGIQRSGGLKPSQATRYTESQAAGYTVYHAVRAKEDLLTKKIAELMWILKFIHVLTGTIPPGLPLPASSVLKSLSLLVAALTIAMPTCTAR